MHFSMFLHLLQQCFFELLSLIFQTVVHRGGVDVQEYHFDVVAIGKIYFGDTCAHIFFKSLVLVGSVAVGELFFARQHVVCYKVGFVQFVVGVYALVDDVGQV